MKKLFTLILITFLFSTTQARDPKAYIHLSILPIIDASAVIASYGIFKYSDNTNSHAAAIVNLSELAITTALGTVNFISEGSNEKVRIMHKIMGIAISASSIWLAASAAVDDDVPNKFKAAAYIYPAGVSVPILLFNIKRRK